MRDAHGEGPLSNAVYWGHEAIVRMLLERPEVDINAVDERGHVPLDIAEKKGRAAIIALLLERSNLDINHRD